MGTYDWPTVKKRLKKTIDQGAKILKESGEEARHIAGRTAHFLELEADVHKLKSRIDKATYQLGETVSQAMGNGRFRITPKLKKMSVELAALKETLKKKEGQIHRTKIIRK